jgi:hypothetical protein
MRAILRWNAVFFQVLRVLSEVSTKDMPDQQTFERQLVSIKEIQIITGLSADVIRDAIKRGELSVVVFSDAPNAKQRVMLEDVWKWIRSKQQPPSKES